MQDLSEHVVAHYDGDSGAILKLVSLRLERNLRHRQPDYPNLHADLLFLGYCIRGHFDEIDTARDLNVSLINTARRLVIFLIKFLSLGLQATSRSPNLGTGCSILSGNDNFDAPSRRLSFL